MSPRPEHAPVFHRNKTMTAIIALCLAAVGSVLYLTPSSQPKPDASSVGQQIVAPNSDAPQLVDPTTGSPRPSSSPTASATSGPTSSSSSHPPAQTVRYIRMPDGRSLPTPVYRTIRIQGRTVVQRIERVITAEGKVITRIVNVPVKVVSRVPVKVPTTVPVTVPARPKHLYCTQFTWQQDAQAAYVDNLTDPWGLDGAPGAHNGDGLACTQLAVDKNRPASTPVDPYLPPSPADKAALAAPATRYFGLAEDGLPSDSPLFNSLAKKVGKAPSALQWFSTWDHGYGADKVRAAWAHGALPIITWMTVADSSQSPTAGTYSLANIINGQFDSYLLNYAGSVIRTGLPVAIRFDHEMNGNWFPWSGGLRANQGAPGDPNLYVQAWRHVWNLFNSVGANDYVIWLWSPVRLDNIKPHSTTPGFKYETSLDEDYPGDAYVDWVGMTAYQYKPTEDWTYEATFRKTLNALHAVSPKPIFISETAATQAVGTSDYSAQKASWTQQTLAGLATEPNVVGFSWFNNTVNDVHQVDGKLIQTDWQFESSPAAFAAFIAGVSDPAFSSGTMPDTTGSAS